MSRFNDYKRIIFPNRASQDALLAAMLAHNGTAGTFDEAYNTLFKETKDEDLQRILAPFLRALAIRHLKQANTDATRDIKQQYTAVIGALSSDDVEVGDAPTFKAFLDEQSADGVYANDLISVALADVLDVNFAFTYVNKNFMADKTKPISYHTSSSPDAPVVHLFNRPNDHFFILEGMYRSTIGDGNCLFNGFAQSCAQQIRYEKNQESNLSDVYTSQQTRYEHIKKLQPIPIAALVERYRTSLSGAERADHELAIHTAREELNNSSNIKTSHFEALIQLVETKAHDFPNTHQDAADKARALARTLTELFASYQTDKITYEIFKEQSLEAIDASKPWLEPHRDWNNILTNLVAAVLGLGMPLLYNRITAGHWFFKMPTDLSSELDCIKQEVECLPCPS